MLYATIINSVIRTIVDNIRYHWVQNNGTFNPAMIVPTGSVPGAFGNGTFGFPNNGDFCSQTTVMCIQPSTLPGAGSEVRRTVGKTISEGTGGKFANGAAYGAFSVAVEGVARSYVDKSVDEPDDADVQPAQDEQFINPTGRGIRGCDDYGCGFFGAPRRNDGTLRDPPHIGADYISIPGQDVRAIGDGTVLRLPDGGIVIDGTVEGTSYKILYLKAARSLTVGSTVKAGQVFGTAQDIRPIYGSQMTNHVHVKLRINGNVVNPAQYIPSP